MSEGENHELKPVWVDFNHGGNQFQICLWCKMQDKQLIWLIAATWFRQAKSSLKGAAGISCKVICSELLSSGSEMGYERRS
jgi:hypothetical protein